MLKNAEALTYSHYNLLDEILNPLRCKKIEVNDTAKEISHVPSVGVTHCFPSAQVRAPSGVPTTVFSCLKTCLYIVVVIVYIMKDFIFKQTCIKSMFNWAKKFNANLLKMSFCTGTLRNVR